MYKLCNVISGCIGAVSLRYTYFAVYHCRSVVYSPDISYIRLSWASSEIIINIWWSSSYPCLATSKKLALSHVFSSQDSPSSFLEFTRPLSLNQLSYHNPLRPTSSFHKSLSNHLSPSLTPLIPLHLPLLLPQLLPHDLHPQLPHLHYSPSSISFPSLITSAPCQFSSLPYLGNHSFDTDTLKQRYHGIPIGRSTNKPPQLNRQNVNALYLHGEGI